MIVTAYIMTFINKNIHMRNTRKVVSQIMISALFACQTSCKHSDKEEEQKKPVNDSVAVFVLTKEPINKQLSFPSELIPYERAEIFAKVNGFIKEIKVDIGDKVQKDQVLAVVEAPEMLATYEQTNSDLQAARSKYMASLDVFKRISNASKVNGTIALAEMEKSKNQMLADSSTLEAAKAKVRAYAELKDYLIIRSPFSGVVTQRMADAGAMVGLANSKPIFVVENVSTLRLRVPVQEAYTNSISDTSQITFVVDAQPDKVYKAKPSRKSGAITKENRTETWEFIFTNDKMELKSGMYANATIKLNRQNPSFVVPPPAVATTLEKKFVIRLKNGLAEWIDVRSGMNAGDKIEIFGKLSEGDTLLKKATDEIKPETKLIPKK